MKVKFSDCIEYMIKGPFGSDMKKSLYIPKGENTYKVYIQANAIQQDETIGDYYISSEYFHQKLARFEVHPGDYIITCDGTLGKHIKLSNNIEAGVISSSLLLLRLDANKIYDKYFELLWDNSMLWQLASQSRNACLVHLPSAKAIGDLEIELPDLSRQVELADKAFKVLDIRAKRYEELKLLDNLVKARFVEMTRSSTTVPTRMGDIATYINGYAFKPDQWEKEGRPIIRIQNLNDPFATYNYFSKDIDNKYLVHKGDVLISWATHLEAYIWDGEEAWLNQHIFRTVFDKMDVDKTYFVFACEDALRQAFKNAHGFKATMEHIKKSDFDEAIVELPDINIQKEFAAFAKQVDKSKAAVQASMDKTQMLFDSLMQQYFG